MTCVFLQKRAEICTFKWLGFFDIADGFRKWRETPGLREPFTA